jgi:hypothetical protein
LHQRPRRPTAAPRHQPTQTTQHRGERGRGEWRRVTPTMEYAAPTDVPPCLTPVVCASAALGSHQASSAHPAHCALCFHRGAVMQGLHTNAHHVAQRVAGMLRADTWIPRCAVLRIIATGGHGPLQGAPAAVSSLLGIIDESGGQVCYDDDRRPSCTAA